MNSTEVALADFWRSDLGREIAEANRRAILERQGAELQRQMDRIIAELPWWARVWVRVMRWVRG